MKAFIGLIFIIGITTAKPAEKPKNYYVFKLAKLNWYGAFIDCLSRNLQLATINSSYEHFALVKALIDAGASKDELWISGSDKAESRSFVWLSTGQPIIFTKWRIGQPDNAGGKENCVSIRNSPENVGNWNDLDCVHKRFYICEDKPGPKMCI